MTHKQGRDPSTPSPPVAPRVGGLYRHYKGGLYRVQATCTVEATQELGVLYASIDPLVRQDLWMRPLSDFQADLKGMPRFAEVPEPSADALGRALPPALIASNVLDQVLARYDAAGRFFHARRCVYALFEQAEHLGVILSSEEALATLFRHTVLSCDCQQGVDARAAALLLRSMAPVLGEVDIDLACRLTELDEATKATPGGTKLRDLNLVYLASEPVQFCVLNEMLWLERRHQVSEYDAPRQEFDTRQLKYLLNLANAGPLFEAAAFSGLEERARLNIEGLRQTWVKQYTESPA